MKKIFQSIDDDRDNDKKVTICYLKYAKLIYRSRDEFSYVKSVQDVKMDKTGHI